jgi:hypothetical protein
MITNIFWYSIFVSELENSQASNLVKIFFLFSQNGFDFISIKTIRADKLSDLVFSKILEGTSMVLSLSRLRQLQNFYAAPSFVIISLSFLTVHVSYIISVILFKLIAIHLFSELSSPKL